MRAAAARVARRRGSSIRMRPSPRQGASSRASGTRVVLPAPGGATSTALRPASSAACSAGSVSVPGGLEVPERRHEPEKCRAAVSRLV